MPDAMRLGMVELGCFRLKELLGRGSYGTVFLAEQEGFNRDAVIKIAHARLVGGRHEELVRSRFAEELRAATRVNHQNVITLFTAGETSDGLPAIAMEYVPGPTLEELLEQRAGALDPVFLHDVFSQFGSAVSAFHRASVTHRDLSPTNIVVGDDVDGELSLKVLDFGVAKTGVDRGRASVVGTPRYMAPEQVVGTSGPESDIYALGAILWWALSGEEFQSEVQTLEDVTEARLMGAKETDIRDVAPEVPALVAELVREMVSFEASDRPSAAEFNERWQECKAALVAYLPAARDVATTPPPRARRTQPADTLECVCVETDHVGIGMLRGFLQGQHCHLRVLPLDGSFDALSSRPDIVFLSAQLPGGATTSLLHRARADFPGVTIVVMISTERERTAMIRAGADYAIRVPADLPHLVEYLDEVRSGGREPAPPTTLEPSTPGPAHPAPFPMDPVESFFGEAPELIADIGQSIETHDAQLARSACAALGIRADELGSRELTAATKALAAFADIGDFTNAAGFKDQIEHEYGVLFRRLMLQR